MSKISKYIIGIIILTNSFGINGIALSKTVVYFFIFIISLFSIRHIIKIKYFFSVTTIKIIVISTLLSLIYSRINNIINFTFAFKFFLKNTDLKMNLTNLIYFYYICNDNKVEQIYFEHL